MMAFQNIEAFKSLLNPARLPVFQPALLKVARDVGELALFQLGLPEDGVRVIEAMVHPALLLDVVQVDEATRVGITVRGREDAPPSQLQGILVAELVAVLGIQHTVRKRLTAADAEHVPGQARAVAVDVVQGGPLLGGDAGAHGAHAQAHALVAVYEVGEDLGGGGDADAALVAELVEAALHAQPAEPVLAVGGAAGEGAEEDAVDLDDLLDRLGGDPVAGRGAGVGGHDDAALEAEGERCCAVGDLDGAVGVGPVVSGGSEPRRRLYEGEQVSKVVGDPICKKHRKRVQNA